MWRTIESLCLHAIQVVHVPEPEPESSEEPEGAVIDFSSDGEAAASAQASTRAKFGSSAAADLRAYDSDSNDEDEKLSFLVRRGAAPAPASAAAATNGSLHQARANARPPVQPVPQPEPLDADVEAASPAASDAVLSIGKDPDDRSHHDSDMLADDGGGDSSSVPASESPEGDSPAGSGSVADSQPSGSPAIQRAPSLVASPVHEQMCSSSPSADQEGSPTAAVSADSLRGISLTPQSLSEGSTESERDVRVVSISNNGRLSTDAAESCSSSEAASSDRDERAEAINSHASFAAETSGEDEEESTLPVTAAGLPELAAERIMPEHHILLGGVISHSQVIEPQDLLLNAQF